MSTTVREFINITTLAKQLGVTLRTLRFWEERGLLQPHRSRLTRLYAPEHVVRATLIHKYSQLGFTIEEIRCLLKIPPTELQAKFRERLVAAEQEQVELAAQITELIRLTT